MKIDSIQERMKYVRKDLLHMTQAEFGIAIGFSANSAANWEKKDAQPISPLAKNAMRRVFSVNTDWLETGEGEPLLEAAPDPLDEIVRANHLTDLDRGILSAYIQLPQSDREVFLACMRSLVNAADSAESNAVASAAESAAVRCETDDSELSESS